MIWNTAFGQSCTLCTAKIKSTSFIAWHQQLTVFPQYLIAVKSAALWGHTRSLRGERVKNGRDWYEKTKKVNLVSASVFLPYNILVNAANQLEYTTMSDYQHYWSNLFELWLLVPFSDWLCLIAMQYCTVNNVII